MVSSRSQLPVITVGMRHMQHSNGKCPVSVTAQLHLHVHFISVTHVLRDALPTFGYFGAAASLAVHSQA